MQVLCGIIVPLVLLASSFALADAACTSPTSRTSWCDGFSINTNYYEEAPDTGVKREYYFNLEQVIASPDGYTRTVYAINGSIPGPTIVADWGDIVQVHITNNLSAARNGTSIHFHGIRQNYTNQMDGVTSITECPIAPGSSTTYTWKATQYGTSWYHSHIGLQAWEGVAGAIVINGPATASYDVDSGPILLSDWSHTPVDELYSSALTKGPPLMSNGLINGTNTWNDSVVVVGERFKLSVDAGSTYRLRLINGAIDTHFKFSIDNHFITVIAMDFVPIQPYNTTVLDIAMGMLCFDPPGLRFVPTANPCTILGQRYDVLVTADQASIANDHWIRAIPQIACSNNGNPDDTRGVLYYGKEPDTPSTTGYSYTDACVDEPIANLVPYVPLAAGSQNRSDSVTVTISRSNVLLWTIDSVSFNVTWSNPTLLQMMGNDSDFSKQSHVIELNEANTWEYLIIQSSFAVSHPIHLHGHDFYILAQGTGTYDSSQLTASANPPRRDVALLPPAGHLVLAFKADNPGAWLMHCHIGWHTNMGLALQFVEQYSVARDLVDYDRLNSTCEAWIKYAASENVTQYMYDDGI
ncbi:hypothetical protein NQ176_g2301 [Zarea fungicola]|uniref:Uncharacterized protein n=1 Tax=Zarea fungicola TaxID=93591 RepID=A0ACC1NRM0_9HYPO|nr:hypothetical protein NQ176_g2301 [Lecanicillium fungicola]